MGLGLGISSSKYDYSLEEGYTSLYNWQFDGTNDAINVGNNSAIKLTATDTSAGVGLTVAVWCKASDWNNISGTKTLVSCFQNSGGWAISWSNRITSILRTNSSTKTVSTNYKPFESASDVHYRASGWHHVVITYDGRYFRLYIDGALSSNINTVDVGSDDNAIQYSTSPASRNTDIVIGADPGLLVSSDGGITFPSGSATISSGWNGYINEVAIWSKALEENEITEIFDYTDNGNGVFDVISDGANYSRSNNAGDDSLVGLWRADGETDVANLAPLTTPAHGGTKINDVTDTSDFLPT